MRSLQPQKNLSVVGSAFCLSHPHNLIKTCKHRRQDSTRVFNHVSLLSKFEFQVKHYPKRSASCFFLLTESQPRLFQSICCLAQLKYEHKPISRLILAREIRLSVKFLLRSVNWYLFCLKKFNTRYSIGSREKENNWAMISTNWLSFFHATDLFECQRYIELKVL